MDKSTWIRKLPDWAKTAILFAVTLIGIIVGIVELVQFYREDFELVITISVVAIFLLLWYLCFHLYLTNETYRIQRFSLTGIFVVPLIFATIFFVVPGLNISAWSDLGIFGSSTPTVHSIGKSEVTNLVSTAGGSVTITQAQLVGQSLANTDATSPNTSTNSQNLPFAPAVGDEILILIATFHLTEGTDDRDVHNEIRRAIQTTIDDLEDDRLRVEVESMRLKAEAQAEARQLGERYKAAMVIWGADSGVRITVNYLNLKEPNLISISETERSQLANPSAYASFVTKDLPAQLTFLSLYAVGQSYYSEERYDDALIAIQQAVAPLTPDIDPPEGIADAYFRLGWLYQGPLDDQLAAIEAYNQVVDYNPDKAIYYYNRGTAYLKTDQYEAAIADYAKAIELSPKYAYAYYNRGNAYYKAGQPEVALADFKEAVKLNQSYAKAYNNLCWVGSLSGQAREVLEACDRAVALASESEVGSFRDSRGVARAINGNYEGALEDFRAYIAWLKENDRYQPGANGREAWLAILEGDQNPFDEATLQALLAQ